MSQLPEKVSQPHTEVMSQPLDLAVHSLPDPRATGAVRPAGRWLLLAIVIACSVPAVAAYFIYFVMQPQGHALIGELIQPVRPIPDVMASGLDGSPRPLSGLKNQWLLVSAGPGGCDPACAKRLFLQRQLRESLGKDAARVDRVWLVTDAAPLDKVLEANMRDAVILRLPEAEVARWLAPASGQAAGNHLYLVDPMGNLMMRFPATLDLNGAAKARRDLEVLLRASASWDFPGRPGP